MISEYPDPIDILIKKVPNKYLLTCIVFLRSKELHAGEPLLIEVSKKLEQEKDYIGMAEEELLADKLEYEFDESK